jgi:hypothetical protein
MTPYQSNVLQSLSLSMSINHFDDQFNRAFPLPNTQIGFLFTTEAPRLNG